MSWGHVADRQKSETGRALFAALAEKSAGLRAVTGTGRAFCVAIQQKSVTGRAVYAARGQEARADAPEARSSGLFSRPPGRELRMIARSAPRPGLEARMKSRIERERSRSERQSQGLSRKRCREKCEGLRSQTRRLAFRARRAGWREAGMMDEASPSLLLYPNLRPRLWNAALENRRSGRVAITLFSPQS
jgi:hypothetical protein